MAVDVNAWIPEEWGSKAVMQFTNVSAVERATQRREPMNTDTRHVPKDGGADVNFVPKGSSYTLDDNAGEEVQLDARKIGAAIPLADEDIKDAGSFVRIVDIKKEAAASGAAILFDNAALAVTGAVNGTTIPYTSVYNGAPAGNKSTLVGASPASAAIRTAVLTAIGAAEDSEWADSDLAILVSPSFRPLFRNLAADGSAGIPLYDATVGSENLAGYPVYWTRGARLAATATQAPTSGLGAAGTAGNAIMVVGPRKMLVVGDRERLASQVTDANTGPGALSDTAYLKVRARKAFAMGDASAFAVVERTSV